MNDSRDFLLSPVEDFWCTKDFKRTVVQEN